MSNIEVQGGVIMLAKRLREIRRSKGVNQQEVADYLGVKRQTYSAYEREISVPDSLVLKKLADYFQVSIEEFFIDDGDDTTEIQEKRLMILARKARDIPADQRERLIQNFGENLDLYLYANNIIDNNRT